MKTKLTAPDRLTQVWKNIGGANFLEPRSLGVLIVPLAILTSIGRSYPLTAESAFQWLVANLAALATIALLVLGLRWLWRTRFPNFQFSWPLVLFISGLLGAMKSFLTNAAFIEIFTTSDHEFEPGRLIGGAIAGIWSLVATSAALNLLQIFGEERMALLMAKSMNSVPPTSEAESRQLAELSAELKLIAKKAENVDAFDAPEMEIHLIRDLVDSHVRPLSSSLYRELEAQYPGYEASELWSSALRASPPSALLALQYLVALPSNVQWFGAAPGIAVTLSATILIFVATTFTSKALNLLGTSGPLPFFFAGGAVPAFAIQFAHVALGLSETVGGSVGWLGFAWFAQTSVVFAVAKIALVRSTAIGVQLAESHNPDTEVDTASLRSRQRRILANQMHGEIQSRLLNILLRRRSSGTMSREEVIAELNSLVGLIERGVVEPQDPGMRILAVQTLWEGFAEIKFDLNWMPEELQQQEVLLALIEEAVANAIRHGMANQLWINTGCGGTLEVMDNGVGPRSGKPGSGTKLLDSTTDWWVLSQNDQGQTILKAKLHS
jgi:hypothetical protein